MQLATPRSLASLEMTRTFRQIFHLKALWKGMSSYQPFLSRKPVM